MSTEWVGFLGISLAFIAFLPQIFHLVKEHCAAGISLRAYAIWWIASLLFLIHAFNINDSVFIALQSFQLAANTVIVVFAKWYEHNLCEKWVKKYKNSGIDLHQQKGMRPHEH